ncbi:SanA/YdcF family protein [Zymobacter palmae]|uniref:Uncharacterized membrane protein n=1 Tax=Zymobacter palmae TaxID=33074 RepID=A0A348HG45_9GAMM|nr:ElyC/SanA/YdcF family protein [Zymobacter palmae]BBG30597.1 uncharacterized membrane protein [Zymobacter palmae]
MPPRAARDLMLRVLSRLFFWCSAVVLAASAGVVSLSLWMQYITRDRIIDSPQLCPLSQVAIVFGTSHRLRNGAPNPYYQGRLDVAAALFYSGRTELLLLSGDNRTMQYNEPVTMWKALRARGIPASTMTRDYAGFSTFDTLIRAHRVFGIGQAVLVSQRWHLPRALLIARHEGIDAYGCAAPGEIRDSTLLLREEWARIKTLWDLYLWPRQPHFLGSPEPLNQPDPITPLLQEASLSYDGDVVTS